MASPCCHGFPTPQPLVLALLPLKNCKGEAHSCVCVMAFSVYSLQESVPNRAQLLSTLQRLYSSKRHGATDKGMEESKVHRSSMHIFIVMCVHCCL